MAEATSQYPSQGSQHHGNPQQLQQEHAVSTSLSLVTAASTPSTIVAALSRTTASSPTAPRGYVVEEETTTVKVPMLRPKPALLKVLHLSGGVGETFTMGDIIHHVKEYISERRLYDEQDPKVVHCAGDLLGTALRVDSFTVHDAIGLFRKNCTLEPDSCIRVHRHLVTRAISNESQQSGVGGAAAYTMASQSARAETSTVSAGSQSSMSQDTSQNCTPDSTNTSQQSSLSSSCSAGTSYRAAESSVTVTDSDLERHQAVTSTDSSSDTGRKARSRENGRKKGVGKKSSVQLRHRSTSINVTYDEPDGACEVKMETSPGEMAQPEDDTVVLEFDSDTFSVEYDVESEPEGETKRSQEDQTLSESDVSSSTSGTALLVVYKESDVEYLADYSDSDNESDAELSDADKWECEYCSMKNPPFQRNCGGCWSVRPDWLPSSAEPMSSSGELSQGGAKNCTDSTVSVQTNENIAITQKTDNVISSVPDVAAVKSSPSKRKYSSCPSSDSQEEKSKGGVDKVIEVVGEVDNVLDEPKKRGKKKVVTVSSNKDDPCVLCLTRRKTASIIHGKTGHQVCCYRCARRLKKQRKSCPICRRPIQKVIRNFHL